jgi:hypothetical protein
MPPSVLKRRERRQTFSYSSSTSDELPTTSLRTACKFLIGSASECQKIVSFVASVSPTCEPVSCRFLSSSHFNPPLTMFISSSKH